MSTRCEFAQDAIVGYYRLHQRMPSKIRMHPVFARALEKEAAWALGRANVCDGDDTFAGIPIERTTSVHSCECLGVQ